MRQICPDCRKVGGNHYASCPTVQSDPRSFEHFDYWAVLWVGHDGSRNLKFHIAGGAFSSARQVLTEFRDLIDQRLKDERKCPYFKEESETTNG